MVDGQKNIKLVLGRVIPSITQLIV